MSRLPQCVFGSRRTNTARLLQNPRAPLPQLLIYQSPRESSSFHKPCPAEPSWWLKACSGPSSARSRPSCAWSRRLASGPVSGAMAIFAARASSDFGFEVMPTVTHPLCFAPIHRAQNIGRAPAGRNSYDHVPPRDSSFRQIATRHWMMNPPRLPQRLAELFRRLQSMPAPSSAVCRMLADIRQHPEQPSARWFPHRRRKAGHRRGMLFTIASTARAICGKSRLTATATADPRDSGRAGFRAWISCPARAMRGFRCSVLADFNAPSAADRQLVYNQLYR